jgi:hypothetical protein
MPAAPGSETAFVPCCRWDSIANFACEFGGTDQKHPDELDVLSLSIKRHGEICVLRLECERVGAICKDLVHANPKTAQGDTGADGSALSAAEEAEAQKTKRARAASKHDRIVRDLTEKEQKITEAHKKKGRDLQKSIMVRDSMT